MRLADQVVDFVPWSFYARKHCTSVLDDLRKGLILVVLWMYAISQVSGGKKESFVHIPTVVPAECMVNDSPEDWSRRWTRAMWADTEGDAVPICP